MHHLRSPFIALAFIALAGCRASYPLQPSATVLSALQVQYRTAMGPTLVGSSFAFSAYTINSDGVYEDVTSKATWASSNSAVVALTGPPSGFSAFAPGLADVSATYQGMVSTLPLTIIEADRQFPVLTITGGDPHVIGRTDPATALLRTTPTLAQYVSGSATWTSSDTRVVTITPSNGVVVVKAVGAGTVRITAVFKGLSASYGLSVQP